jgi:hypothetical protein
MAKIVKVKMNRVQSGSRIQNSYPAPYDPKKVQVIAYEDLGNVNKPYCIGVVKDEDLAAFTASPDIVEISQQEAETFGAVWRPQVKKITDMNKVLNILDKVHNSSDLTQAEKDAINPDNAELGINKSTAFTDLLSSTIGAVNNG